MREPLEMTFTSRPPLPARSDSQLSGRTPSDARKPDIEAVSDVYNKVEETGSLDAAARKLQQYAESQRWGDDPEEADFQAAEVDVAKLVADVADKDEVGKVVHLQEVVEGLWIGDLVAAMDTKGLQERGITNILSLLRPALKFPPQFAHYPLEIDDSADTDILTHLPSCVAWIQEALDQRSVSSEGSSASTKRDKAISPIAGGTKAGGVLVHCQAGMSRSATVVAAYLMQTVELDPMDAIEMIKEKRSVVDPSQTFWYQLGLFYNADGHVTLKDRSTRQYYMERTTSQVLNGDGGAPPLDKMAKYPTSPSISNPPTPAGGHGRRKIRCKMCRRHLAVREHMMDHILEQSPISRPRTPSNFALPSSVTSSSNDNPSERRPSAVSDVVNPLTGLPGATIRSRHASMSSGPTSPVQTMHERENSREKESSIPSPGVPLPRTATPGLILTMSSPEVLTGRLPSETLPANPLHSKPSPSPSTDTPRQLQSAEQLASRLPPHLQALRTTSLGMSGLPSPFQSSPAASPERDSSPRSPIYAFPPAGGVSRKMSLLAMTPSEGSRNQSRSGSAEHSSTNTPAGPPILVNPKCSGYFVEPLTWMEPVLRNGDIGGKLVCPNEKCGVKIGNFDWAGVQCGCKEWVTPGFCIHRSKVDEVW